MKESATPLLLMDVDGVLNPYPDCPDGFAEYEFFPDDDEPVRLSTVHGQWLYELREHFSIVWATGWGEDANRLLCPHFGLPEFPVVIFPPVPFPASLKVPAIDSFVGDRAVAWVDDMMTKEARRWAEARKSATLLVEADPAIGLTRDAVDRLLAWGRAQANANLQSAT